MKVICDRYTCIERGGSSECFEREYKQCLLYKFEKFLEEHPKESKLKDICAEDLVR